MITYCDGESGHEIVRLTREQAAQMSHQGQCDADVEYNLDRVEWLADDDRLRSMLKGYGAWDDLATCDQHTLRMRALWTAACDINENPRDYPEDEGKFDMLSTVSRIMHEQAPYFGGPAK
jgi:hypothetical protein